MERELTFRVGPAARTAGPHLPGAILDQFWDAVERNPQRPAVVQAAAPAVPRRSWSYHKLARQVTALAAVLAADGLQRGDRVSLLLPGVPEFVAACFGALQAGAAVVPVDPRLPAADLVHILNDSGTHTAIVHDDCGRQVLALWEQGRLPRLQTVIWVGGHTPRLAIPWDLCVRAGSDGPLRRPAWPAARRDQAVILYSAGAAGHPQGAALSHGQLLDSVAACRWAFGDREQGTRVVAVPLWQPLALHALMEGLAAGSTLVLLRQPSPLAAVAALAIEGADALIGHPDLLLPLLAGPGLDPACLARLRTVAYAGAPVPAGVVRRLKRRFPAVRCHNLYDQDGIPFAGSPL